MSVQHIAEKPAVAWQVEEILTACIAALVLLAAGAGLFVPGFYQGVVDPRYATGIITADLISLFCVPLLIGCMIRARQDSLVARLICVSLLLYLGYAYAVYAFDRMYTVLFPLYMAIFGICCFAIVVSLARLDVDRVAGRMEDLPLRRVTAVFLVFTGLVLYAIEAPIILSRIPGGTGQGGTPFMVLDLTLIAPVAVLTGIWLWQRRPWGAALAGIFLIKAVTLMTSFLLADYYDWYIGKLTEVWPTIAFTIVNLLAYGFVWNYFHTLRKKDLIK
jgi:hypothetical protein